jgi:hypothetical protein
MATAKMFKVCVELNIAGMLHRNEKVVIGKAAARRLARKSMCGNVEAVFVVEPNGKVWIPRKLFGCVAKKVVD